VDAALNAMILLKTFKMPLPKDPRPDSHDEKAVMAAS